MQNRAQRMVGALDSSQFVGLLRGTGVLLAAVLLVVLFARTQFTALESAHAMEMADTARHLASGNGYRTAVIHPVDVALGARDQVAESVPQLAYPPVWPALLSWSMRMAPSEPQGPLDRLYPGDVRHVLPVGVLCLVVAALCLYLFARRYAGAGVASAVVLMFLGGIPAVQSVCGGDGLPAASLFAVLAIWLAWEALIAKSGWLQVVWVALAGGAAGLAMLTWWSAWVVVGVVCIFMLVEMRRLRSLSVMLFLLVVIAVVAPFVVHLFRACGLPFGTAPIRLASAVAPAGSVGFRESLDVVPAVDVVVRTIRESLISGVTSRSVGLPLLGSLGGFLLFLSVFRRYELPGGSGLRYGLLLGVGVAWAMGMLTGRTEWVVFLPLLLLLGVSAFADAMRSQEFFTPDTDRVLVLVLVLVTVGPTLLKASASRASAYPPVHPRLQAWVCEAAGTNGVLITDIPAATAWYGDRPSLGLPRGYAEWSGATSNLVVDGLLLTGMGADDASGRDMLWQQLWHGEVSAGGMTNAYWLPAGTHHQLLLIP